MIVYVGSMKTGDRMEIDLLVPKYQSYLLSTQRAPSTQALYVGIARRFVSWIDEKPLTPEVVSEYTQVMLRDRARSTARSVMVSLGVFFRWLEETQQVPRGFVSGTPQAPKMQSGPPTVASSEEVEILLSYTKKPYDLIFAMMSGLGLRVSEVTRIKWEDLDMHRKVVLVNRKGGKLQELPLDIDGGRVLSLLEQHKKRSEWLFAGANGGAITRDAVNKTITRACDKLGLRHLNPHSMRHQFAHAATMNQTPTTTLSAALGHSSLTTTQRYQQQLTSVDAIRSGFGVK
jgi:integrase